MPTTEFETFLESTEADRWKIVHRHGDHLPDDASADPVGEPLGQRVDDPNEGR